MIKSQNSEPAFRRCTTAPVWVSIEDIDSILSSMNLSSSARQQLSEWISRKFSLAFVAGQRRAKPIADTHENVSRMLQKMGYRRENVEQLTTFIVVNLPYVYEKGKSRKNILH